MQRYWYKEFKNLNESWSFLTKNTDTYKYNDYAVTYKELFKWRCPCIHHEGILGNGDPATLIRNIQRSFVAPAKSPVPTQEEVRRAMEPVCEKNLTPCWESNPVNVMFHSILQWWTIKYTRIVLLQKVMIKKKKNSVALVHARTIPTERPPPVGEVSANFCG